MTDALKQKRDEAANAYCASAITGRCHECGYFPLLVHEDAYKAGWDACWTEAQAENARLKEALSHLPKVPTEPYEKEMAREIARLKDENERLQVYVGYVGRSIWCALNNWRDQAEKYKREVEELKRELEKRR